MFSFFLILKKLHKCSGILMWDFAEVSGIRKGGVREQILHKLKLN